MGAHGPGGGFGGAAQETTYSIPADKCGLVIGKGVSFECLVLIYMICA